MKSIMMIKRTACIVFAWLLTISSQAFCSGYQSTPSTIGGDEDTILIEKQEGSQKIPYALIVRKLGQHFFNFDTYGIVTISGDKEQKIARSFTDYLVRSKYRFNMKKDEFELKYSVKF